MRARIILTALAALVGAGTAASLLVDVPAEESGRVVEAAPVAPPADAGAGAAQRPPAVEILGFRGRQYLRAYRDIAGIWTICDGITRLRQEGRGVRPGDVETGDGCLRRLEEEIVIHARGALRCVPGLAEPGRGHQLRAAVSLTFNIGVGGFCGSTTARRFRAGDWRGGCDAMLRWNKARVRGRLVAVRGLTLRRQRERAICLTGLS